MNKQSRKLKITVVFCIFFLILGFIFSNNLISSVYANSEDYFQSTPQTNSDEKEWSTTEALALGSAAGDAYVNSSEIDDLGNLHIFWSIHSDEIYYKIWFVENQVWSSDELIVSESYNDYSSTIDTDNNLYLGWVSSSGFKFICRNSSTGIWSSPETIVTTDFMILQVELSVDKFNTLHFMLEDTRFYSAYWEYDIFLIYNKRYSNGTLATPTTLLIIEFYSYLESLYGFDLCIDNEANVRLIFTSIHNGRVYLKNWEYATKTWSSSTQINPSYPTSFGENPTLDADSEGNIHCIWSDSGVDYLGSGGDSDICYRFLNITSQVWSSVSIVSTESTDNSISPSITVDSYNDLHVSWHDYSVLFDSGSEPDILYKKWSYATQKWSALEFVSSEGTGDSIKPLIEVDKFANIHCLWTDNSTYGGGTSYYNVFYKNKFYLDRPLVLEFIIPNPNYNGIINLDWSNVSSTQYYYVYRSTSFIYTVASLTPIATVTISEYQDTISSDGIYYYVIAAVGSYGTKLSQCEYVEVLTPSLESPILATILPNPSDSASVTLEWNSIEGASEYYIYRSVSFIWDIEGLVPIDTVALTNYLDILPSEGDYFYVIVATDGISNSTVSNCEHIEYKIAHVNEFGIISSMILGATLLSFVIMKFRKKKLK